MTMPKKVVVEVKLDSGRTNWIVNNPSALLVTILRLLFNHHQNIVNTYGLYLQSCNYHDIRVEFMAPKPKAAVVFLNYYINKRKTILEARQELYGYNHD